MCLYNIYRETAHVAYDHEWFKADYKTDIPNICGGWREM